jgi:hypothetical protein
MLRGKYPILAEPEHIEHIQVDIRAQGPKKPWYTYSQSYWMLYYAVSMAIPLFHFSQNKLGIESWILRI